MDIVLLTFLLFFGIVVYYVWQECEQTVIDKQVVQKWVDETTEPEQPILQLIAKDRAKRFL